MPAPERSLEEKCRCVPDRHRCDYCIAQDSAPSPVQGELPELDVSAEDKHYAYLVLHRVGTDGDALRSATERVFCRERQLRVTKARAEAAELALSTSHASGKQEGRKECLDAVKVMQAKLREKSIHMEWDCPGDTPEPCGLWCELCKEYVDDDRIAGHKPTCLLAEQAILALERKGQ